jgi:hypothetical protein
MKIAVRVVRAAAVVALVLPVAARAQYSGVSHPDDAPIMNNPDTGQQAYQPKKTLVAPQPELAPQPGFAPQAGLKPNPQIPMDATPTVPAETRRVEPMMTDTASIKPDADAGIVTRIPGPSNQLPVGSLMKVRIAENISTESTPSGMKFTAQLMGGVERDGRILVPAGSVLTGYVTEIHGGKRMSGAASIHLKTSTITLPDGTKYMVRGQVIDTDMFKVVRVDGEGTIHRRDHAGKTAGTMALATGSGAAAGALIGGVPGALIGAGVGAGVSTVVWMKQDRQAELPSETLITFSLTEPLTVGNE